jgi:hypothetical protein
MLRTLPRSFPRARLVQARSSFAAFKAAQPKFARSYAAEAAIPPSPRDSFANGGNQLYMEE